MIDVQQLSSALLRRKEPEIAASNLVERRADAKIRTFFSSVP